MGSLPEKVRDIHLANLKRGGRLTVPNSDTGEKSLQKLKGAEKIIPQEAGIALDLARKVASLDAKGMADTMGISHSLVLRGLASQEHLSFHRLWELSDAFWLELIIQVCKHKKLATVRRKIEIEEVS